MYETESLKNLENYTKFHFILLHAVEESFNSFEDINSTYKNIFPKKNIYEEVVCQIEMEDGGIFIKRPKDEFSKLVLELYNLYEKYEQEIFSCKKFEKEFEKILWENLSIKFYHKINHLNYIDDFNPLKFYNTEVYFCHETKSIFWKHEKIIFNRKNITYTLSPTEEKSIIFPCQIIGVKNHDKNLQIFNSKPKNGFSIRDLFNITIYLECEDIKKYLPEFHSKIYRLESKCINDSEFVIKKVLEKYRGCSLKIKRLYANTYKLERSNL
jgi:hypothetical protein